MIDIEIIKKLLKKLKRLEKNNDLFSQTKKPLRTYPSRITRCVIKSLIREISADENDFFGPNGEICLLGKNGIQGLKSLTEEFISIFEDKGVLR